MNSSHNTGRPIKDPRNGIWEPTGPWAGKCPYCLEPVGQLELEAQDAAGLAHTCAICRHALLPTLLGTPPHEFNRPQQWDYLANEIEYIWDWEFALLRSFRQCMASHHSDAYSDAKESLECLLDAKTSVLGLREELLEREGEIDFLIVVGLERIEGGDGTFSKDLLKGRKWRQRAAELSEGGAPKRPVAEFQVEMIKATSWGAFGSFDMKQKVVDFLEARLEREGN